MGEPLRGFGMRIAAATLAVVIGVIGSCSAAFAFAPIGLKASLDNCLNVNLSSPQRIEACSQVIHTNVFPPKTQARVITLRGNAYFASGDLESALDDYNRAVSLDAGLQPSVVNRAVTLVRLGKCEQADVDLGAVLASDSHSWRALYGRSLCEAKAGDQAGAQTDLAAANAINPKAAQEFAPVELPRWYQ